MKTFEMAVVPGAIAGVLSVFTSWFWMGVVFHRFQERTPATWRAESGRSYALSSALRLLACIAIATLFLFAAPGMGRFFAGESGSLRFALLLWCAVAAPFALESAIYIKLHPAVVAGQLLDWLTTVVLACALTAWWSGR